MKNPLTRTLIPTASLLAFASVVAAQNTQSLQQLEGKVSTLPQASGSSLSGFLNSARYEFGRGLTFSSPEGENSMTIGGQVQVGYGYTALLTLTQSMQRAPQASRARGRVGSKS